MPYHVDYHAATREAAVYDATGCGRIALRGADHLDFLHRMSTNALLGLAPRQGARTVFCDHRGRVVEVVELCRVDADESVAFVGPGRAPGLLQWLEHFHFSEEVAWRDATAETGQLELVGPRAATVAESALALSLAGADPLGLVADALPLRVCRVDAARSTGLRLWGPRPAIDETRSRLADAGVPAIGEATWEVLRVEDGRPLPGRELTLDHNPWEAGLADAIHLNKGCYVGQEVLARLDTYSKVKQHLVGLLLAGPAASGDPVAVEGRPVGWLTSVAFSPGLESWTALAYLRSGSSDVGTTVAVGAAGGTVAGQVRALPFRRA